MLVISFRRMRMAVRRVTFLKSFELAILFTVNENDYG